MKKIMELRRKYPVITYISSYFVTTFIGTGAIALTFDRDMWEVIFLASIASVVGGITAAVKVVDKDSESE